MTPTRHGCGRCARPALPPLAQLLIPDLVDFQQWLDRGWGGGSAARPFERVAVAHIWQDYCRRMPADLTPVDTRALCAIMRSLGWVRRHSTPEKRAATTYFYRPTTAPVPVPSLHP